MTAVGTSFPHHERISLVIPVLNEEEGLAALIEKAGPYAGEVLVIDGHSTDRSAAVAAACGALVHYDNRKGKGDALRRAIPLVTPEITVFLDADGSHDPEDIPLLVEPILAGEADHVTASRLRGGSSELHGGFDEFCALGQLFHHRLHQLALQLSAQRQPERVPGSRERPCCGSSTFARTRRRSNRR